jgi:hypothetical protein
MVGWAVMPNMGGYLIVWCWALLPNLVSTLICEVIFQSVNVFLEFMMALIFWVTSSVTNSLL